MKLENKQIIQLGKGQKLSFKANRGKKIGSMLRFDRLAGAVAVVCNGSPGGISASVIYTKVLAQKFKLKSGKSISKNMISARVDKLWAIGHVNKREEPIIIEGTEGRYRYIYHQGEETDVGAIQQQLAIEGKFTQRRMARIFKDVYSFRRPENKFQEAIYDIMSDDSDVKFPTTLADYKKAVANAFTEELYREDRFNQLHYWALEFINDDEINEFQGLDSMKLVIAMARKYSTGVWDFVTTKMSEHQERVSSPARENFNQDHYEELTSRDPDFWKSIKKLKEEGKFEEIK